MADNIPVEGNLDLNGNQIKNVAIEVVTSLPTTDIVGRQVTYEGRSYIWDGSAWKCDSDYLEIGGRNLALNTLNSYSAVGIGGANQVVSPPYPVWDFEEYGLVPDDYITITYYWQVRSLTAEPISGNMYLRPSVRELGGALSYNYFNTNRAYFSNSVTKGMTTITRKIGNAKGIISWMFRLDAPTNVELTLYNVKLEKGNIATDWTPAPEDKADVNHNHEIGGRNLILNSKEERFTDNTAGSELINILTFPYLFSRNSEYVLSFDVKGTGQYNFVVSGYTYPIETIASNGAIGTDSGGNIDFDATDVWERVWIKIRTINWGVETTPNKRLYLGVHAGSNLYLKELKFEKGNIATDWTPAPEDKADENQTINYDTSNIEPTQSGTVTKTSTWLWQYLTQSINFLWLKLKDLFPTTQATTHNYLPKINNSLKKLVKSNIYDNGTNVGIGTTTLSEKLQVDGNVKANGYKVGSGTDTKLLTDGGGTKLITDFAQLDENDKIKATNLPDYLLGQVLYGGSIDRYQTCTLSLLYKDKFNITANTRPLANLTALSHVGVYFIASGNFLLNGTIDVTVGDWVISDGNTWGKIDNTDAVASVNGLTGVINLTYGDLGAMPPATNTKVGGVKLGIVTEGLDADLLDGNHASDFATSTHNHDTTYLGKADPAVDSAKLGGELPSYYEPAFTKNTAFNKAFGTGSSDVAKGNHGHSELHTHENKPNLDAVEGTNTGDETTERIGTLISEAAEKTTPADDDMVGLMDSAARNILKKLSWKNIKATLKTYFDTLYARTSFAAIKVGGVNVNATRESTVEFLAGANVSLTADNAAKTITIAASETIQPLSSGGTSLNNLADGIYQLHSPTDTYPDPVCGNIVGTVIPEGTEILRQYTVSVRTQNHKTQIMLIGNETYRRSGIGTSWNEWVRLITCRDMANYATIDMLETSDGGDLDQDNPVDVYRDTTYRIDGDAKEGKYNINLMPLFINPPLEIIEIYIVISPQSGANHTLEIQLIDYFISTRESSSSTQSYFNDFAFITIPQGTSFVLLKIYMFENVKRCLIVYTFG